VKLAILLSVFSPWFLMIIMRPTGFKPVGPLISPTTHTALTETNTYQSQSPIGKLVSNKFIYTAREMVVRFVETFDPHYLFLEGDLNYDRSTQKNGPLFVSVFVLALLYPKKKAWKWGFLLLSPTMLFDEHFFSPSKILFFIFVGYLAGLQLSSLNKNQKIVFWIAWLFEFSLFAHSFVFHYLT
jgi:hypothetical protein